MCDTIEIPNANTQVTITGEFCYTPSQEAGTCVFLPECPYLVQIYGYQPRNRDVINYLIASQTNCGRRSVNRNPIVSMCVCM